MVLPSFSKGSLSLYDFDSMQELTKLMASVQKFREKGQVRYLEEYLDDLSSIKKNLAALQARCERIQYEEELVGWDHGDFEVNEAQVALEPYDKLWTLVYEHQKAGNGEAHGGKHEKRLERLRRRHERPMKSIENQ